MESSAPDLMLIEDLILNNASPYEIEQEVSLKYWKERYLMLLEKYNLLMGRDSEK